MAHTIGCLLGDVGLLPLIIREDELEGELPKVGHGVGSGCRTVVCDLPQYICP